MAERIRLGVTGGIGSGKSRVCAILRERFGIPVYDCDREAKRLIATHADLRRQLAAIAGEDVFEGGTLQRERLARFLFASRENARRVDAAVHPAVVADAQRWQAEQDSRVVAIESAILYESGLGEAVDMVLFVDAPEEVRLRRAMRRDNASPEQIQERMRMQQPALAREKADAIIDNGAETDDDALCAQLEKALSMIRERQLNQQLIT